MRLTRTPDPDPQAAARVAALARPVGPAASVGPAEPAGWVPGGAPEPARDEGGDPRTVPRADHRPDLWADRWTEPPTRPPSPAAVRDPGTAGAPEEPWSGGPAPRGPGNGPPVGPGTPADGSVLGRLRAGRLDPGRRGVAALALVAVLACALAAVVVLRGRPEAVVAPPAVVATGAPVPGAVPASPTSMAGAPVVAPPGGDVVVAVGGKVRRPGLVRLPAGSRVADAVTAAGGPVSPADLDLVNVARKVVDGEQVLIGVEAPPGAPPGATPPDGTPVGPTADGTIDLNTAAVGELDELPGIGPVLAQKIVDYRTENGGFGTVEQLREVSGIGDARFDELKDRVRV